MRPCSPHIPRRINSWFSRRPAALDRWSELKLLGRSRRFAIEQSKTSAGKIRRPVYFGESGVPSLAYEIGGFHAEWRCGIEIEAGRGWMGNAVYRDLVQALIMVNVEHLVLAVANTYKYVSSGKAAMSKDYDNTLSVAEALYGHSRVRMPYGPTVIGY